jgi:hypothetical protein
MKAWLIFVFIAILIGNASALQLSTHYLEINLDSEGKAHIFEKYEITFFSSLELSQFRAKVAENSSSIDAWKVDYPFFFPRFADAAGNKLDASFVTFDEEQKTLTLEYFLEKPFSILQKDEPRATLWAIPDSQFGAYIKQSLIIIPQNTVIRINLPNNGRVLPNDIPAQATVQGNSITISGITTNNMNLKYIIQKPLSPSFNSFQFVREFFFQPSNYIFVFLAIVIIGAIYWKKETIKSKIEKYVEDHSEIEEAKQEDDVELEIGKE